jgi:molybdenum cofactor biosynthesis protein B
MMAMSSRSFRPSQEADVNDASKVRVATITVSDSRTEADDTGGQLLRERLVLAGFATTFSAIVKDEPLLLRAAIADVCDRDLADAIVTTGGTGITPRDQTYEAIDALLEKRLDGFGEAFRRLSWDDIGARAILSRAVAGTHRTRILVALPGSPKALALAVDQILAPMLAHAVALAQGKKHGH